MEPRRSRKDFRRKTDFKENGLSYGVANMDGKSTDREANKFLDFLMQTFLFLLGGVILCGMLLALLTIT